ncbi:MAG: helix-turn-helix transcriptional regulator [Oscillospiraceae bacterium]|nr:helix-turn-helix transcriptional regulator [Oscillospiraceae bacterium]
MKNKTMGEWIAELRKEQGLTQLQLAEKMCVTDKAVSKWERDLSYPDTSSIPKLAEVLGTTVEGLMLVKGGKREATVKDKINGVVTPVLKAIPLSMGVGVVVLSILKQLDAAAGVSMLGIGLFCLSLENFRKNGDQ